MAFSLLSQMEGSRQQKEALLRRKARTKPIIAAGIFIFLAALTLIALTVYASAPAQSAAPSADATASREVSAICIGCLGLPAIILLVLGGAATLYANQQVKNAEQEYQELNNQVIALIEGK